MKDSICQMTINVALSADGNEEQEGSHQEQYFGFFVVQSQRIEDAVKPAANIFKKSLWIQRLLLDSSDNIWTVLPFQFLYRMQIDSRYSISSVRRVFTP